MTNIAVDQMEQVEEAIRDYELDQVAESNSADTLKTLGVGLGVIALGVAVVAVIKNRRKIGEFFSTRFGRKANTIVEAESENDDSENY